MITLPMMSDLPSRLVIDHQKTEVGPCPSFPTLVRDDESRVSQESTSKHTQSHPKDGTK